MTKTTDYPWNQQAGESSKAYRNFCHFRDAGPGRELRAIYRQVASKPDVKQASGQWLTWYGKWEWKNRALAWDAEQQRIRDEATQKAVAKVSEKTAAKQEISAQRVLNEEANLAFGRVTNLLSWKGVAGLVDSEQLSDEDAATIESVEFGYNAEAKERYVKKVNFHAKQPALGRLGEHLKLWGSKEQGALPQHNFVTFFLEVCKNGELQREAERRGLISKTEAIEVQGNR
jgi:terminase small subunit-like protein